MRSFASGLLIFTMVMASCAKDADPTNEMDVTNQFGILMGDDGLASDLVGMDLDPSTLYESGIATTSFGLTVRVRLLTDSTVGRSWRSTPMARPHKAPYTHSLPETLLFRRSP